MEFHMYQQLLTDLNEETLIIAVNQRLCAHLQLEFAKLQPDSVFPTPPITALSPWLKQQWEACQQPERLLDSQQVHWLWQQVIEQSSQTDFILPTAQISQLANDAYSQMLNWQVPWDEFAQSNDNDHQTFLRWAQEFDALLKQHQAITPAHLPTRLQACCDKSTWPKNIYLAGFQDMPPALQLLLKSATPVATSSLSQSVNRTEASNSLAELSAMAHWAKNHLETSAQTPRIGCVIPELQALRKQTADIFQRTFRTDHSPITPEAIFPFNISAGIPLLDYPMLRDGYEILRLTSENSIDTDQLRHVLGSPYLFPLDDGMVDAAELDVELHEQQLSSLSVQQLQHALQNYPTLQRLSDYLTLTPAPVQFPSEWAQHCITQLETIGWPGSQSLSSEEYQLLGQWNNKLQELSQLDDLTGPISWHNCLKQMQYLLSSTAFQAQTDRSNAPIQVLGSLEAAGLPFDYLWIMGLDDSAWPPAAQTNPFIPIQLQQRYQLPHNSAEHELNYCQQLQASLISHAKETILSSPAQDNSSNKQPSALIRNFPYEILDTPVETSRGTNELENFGEDYAPPLKPAQKLRGGSSITSNQAACPFRAFAQHRLGAHSPADSVFGVSALTHGILLHAALESLWRELKNQQTLLTLSHDEQLTRVQTHVQRAIEQSNSVPARFRELEHQRLVEQINNWLQLERERPAFQVTAIERSEQLNFAGHTMTVRMDRIDELADGSKVILDYKTSRLANPVKWLTSPPLDSQLPFYACFSQDSHVIQGCSYAVINREGCEFRGYANAEQTDYIPLSAIETASKYTPYNNWTDAVESWREQLQSLIDSFIAGYAAVAPNPLARPCDHCDLSALCRIEESEAV
jgi:probable DNA repair protein